MAIDDTFVPARPNGPGHSPRVLAMAADGAITIADGKVFVTKGTACVMTIDTPPTSMNGAKLEIISTTAAAHTLTHTPGFGGGTTARDVATWGGAINDSLCIVAYEGVWYIDGAPRNVTIA